MPTPERTHEPDRAQPGPAFASGAPHARTVSACLERDHRALDALLEQSEALAREDDLAAARRVFAGFRAGLELHIEAEEEILFPVFEQGCVCDGPTNVMLGEHADIRRSMAAVADALQRSESFDAARQIRDLARVLHVHNLKEERVLYPQTDAALEHGVEREALVARLEERLKR